MSDKYLNLDGLKIYDKNIKQYFNKLNSRLITIENKQTTWDNKSDFSGLYDDLTGKPQIFSGDYSDLTSKPELFSGNYDDLTGKPELFDGDYNSLINKPTIPSAYNDAPVKQRLSQLESGIDTTSLHVIHYGNQFDETKITRNAWLNDDGSLHTGSDASNYIVSDYIKVTSCYESGNLRYVAAYSYKNFGLDVDSTSWGPHARQICYYSTIGGPAIGIWSINSDESNTGIKQLPAGTNYVRVCFMISDQKYFYVGFQQNTVPPTFDYCEQKIPGNIIPSLNKVVNNTDSSVTALLKTAMDYYGNLNFQYGNNHTLFDDVCGDKFEPNTSPNFNGSSGWPCDKAYHIDCSSFVQACLEGISFKNSRYINSNNYNIRGFSSYIFDQSAITETVLDDGQYYSGNYGRLYANQIAEYAYNHGYLYAVNKDFSNVKAGDLLFQNNSHTWQGLYFWRDIGHVMIVSQTVQMNDGRFFVKTLESRGGSTSSGNTCGVTQRLIYPWYIGHTGYDIIWGARFPLSDCQCNIVNICDDIQISSVGLGTAQYYLLKSLPLNKPLKQGGLYTLAFKADIPDGYFAEYWICNGSNDQQYYNIGSSGSRLLKRPSGVYCVHIEIPNDINIPNDSNKVFEIFLKNCGGSGGTSIIYDAKLYNGYITCNDYMFD